MGDNGAPKNTQAAPPAKENPWKDPKKAILIPMLILVNTLWSLLPRVFYENVSEVEGVIDMKPLYITQSMVFFSEVFKFSVSYTNLKSEDRFWSRMFSSESLIYAIPGVCYFINNNMAFSILSEMDPATFMILKNANILVTALLFGVFLKRAVSTNQWKWLICLMLGCAVTQFPEFAKQQGGGEPSVTLFGLILVGFYVLLSSSAGVYNEKLLKGSQDSIHMSNALLYGYGMALNLVVLLWTSGGQDMFRGWNHWSTFAICTIQSCGGLLIAQVYKHFDNMAKIIAFTLSNLAVYALQVVFLGMDFSPVWMLGAGIVMFSVQQYKNAK